MPFVAAAAASRCRRPATDSRRQDRRQGNCRRHSRRNTPADRREAPPESGEPAAAVASPTASAIRRRPVDAGMFPAGGRRAAAEGSMTITDEVFNQPAPLDDVNLFGATGRCATRWPSMRPAARHRAGLAALGALAGSARDAVARPAGQRAPAAAAQPRPLRAAHRPGRVPSELPRADGRRDRRRACTARRGRRRSARRTCGARPASCSSPSRAVGAVPGLDDLRRHAGAARQCRASRRLGAAADAAAPTTRASFRARKPAVTMGMGMTEKQGGSDVRANTTRAEADGRDGWGERCRAHRPQVVLLGADVRCVPGAGAGAGRADLLLPAALRPTSRRHA